MRLLFTLTFLITILLGSDKSIDAIAKAGSCYSILVEVDASTPISENYFQQKYRKKSCTLFDKPPLFFDKKAYIGCYRRKKRAQKRVTTLSSYFKNPKIVLHRFSDGIPYVIFPQKSRVNLKKALHHLDTIYKDYSISNVLRKFPTKYNGSHVEIYNLDQIDFLPSINLYSLYNHNGKKSAKVLLLRDGSYSIETLYKQLKGDSYIKKVDQKTYEINIPIVVMPTASLTIANKTVHLQTRPKSVVIMYYGNLYIKNSKFFTWDMQRDKYCPREDVPSSKILYTNYENPRPYFLGLQGSRGYFVNNIFKGLGFHSTSATFGLGVLSPKKSDYYPLSRAFYYFLNTSPAPTGAYIGNDIYNSTMAFYTNGGKNIVYLGNYTHDNVIYNFDPHDYSTGLVIARNLSIGAKKAHGIIISRGCDNNTIAENITLKNSANGIMIDRQSNNNLIYNNLAYENGFMGISSIESKNILVKNNMAVGNYIDGIMVRNTLHFYADNNALQYNAKNGIEVMAKSIDRIPGRDFRRDPYAKASSAVIFNNSIQNNYNSNIMVKNGAGVRMQNNAIPNNRGLGGDLNFFYGEVMHKNGDFRLYGLGFPYVARSTDLLELGDASYKTATKILLDIAKTPNDYVGTHLGGLYVKREPLEITKAELIRASLKFSKGALRFLGYIYLTQAKKENFRSQEKIIQGMSYIIEDAMLGGGMRSYREIEKMRLFLPKGEYFIKKAFALAKSRMVKGMLFDAKSATSCYVCTQTRYEKSKVMGAFKLFEYNYKQTEAKSFLAYCKIRLKHYTLFTTLVKNHFNRLINGKNIIKERVHHYNTRVAILARKDKLCTNYLQKKRKDFKKTQAMMQNEKMKKLEFVKPKTKELLQKINRFRVRKISIKQLLKIMQEDGYSSSKNLISSIYYE